jgi:glycosyltransferase involved in cell wall biosynthesis
MKKKIAFLTTQYREVKSGPGRFTEYLKSLDFETLEIHFFSQQIENPTQNEFPVPIPGWAQRIPFSSFFRAWFFNKAVLKQDKVTPYDFILAADYSMAMFLDPDLLKKTAVMVNDDNFLLIYSNEVNRGSLPLRTSLSRKLGYFFERSVVRKAAFSVANSLYTKELIESRYEIASEKVKLLYKAVDLSFFQFRKPEAKPPTRFLFVKNDWKRGGLDLILSAFSQLEFQDGLEIRMAGIAESQQETVKALIRNSGFRGKSEILGLVNRAQLKQMLGESDVFVNFSRQEALGVSCLEAMASGVPVLASDAGGLKEVLANGKAGFMVRSGDVSALAATLREMHHHPEILPEKALAALAHADAFSVERLRKNMDGLFES